MTRRPTDLLLCLCLLPIGLGAVGCRSAGWGSPQMQVHQSTELLSSAAAEVQRPEIPHRSRRLPQTPASPPLVLCSGAVMFGDSTDEALTPGPEPTEDAFTSPVDPQFSTGTPGEESFTFRSDLHQAGSMLWDDTKAIFEWRNAAILGVGLGATLAIRSTLDDDVRSATYQHGDRWGGGSEFLSNLGEAYVQWPAWMGIYAYSLHTGNEELHDFSGALFSSLAITGVASTIVKFSANTDRPSTNFENGHYGFPSYHAASSFAIASVIDEYYGHRVGVPAYALAGLIGWSRIDLRAHDLSDVVFGAILGTVIGKSVAHFHRTGDGRVNFSPWYEPNSRCTGVMMEMKFD
ncbi:MAG: phosphatase PAP2 family protein [Planctomycetaceae bacterium]